MEFGLIGWLVAAILAAAWAATAFAMRGNKNSDRARAEAERARFEQLGLDAARLQEKLSGSAESAARLQAERDEARAALHAAGAQRSELEQRLARVDAERAAAVGAHEDTKQFLQEAQVKLRSAFLEVASKVFDEKSIALDQRIKESGEASKLGIEGTLKPFADQLGQFRERIEQFAKDQGKDQASLVGALSELRTLNQHMAASTDNLSRALKGNAKVRGDWGEMILETVLKASGLVEGRNYLRQDASRDDESGRLRKPDVIVLLPDGRRVVVDSKVNLVAWAEANDAESGDTYNDAMLRHATAMRAHMRDLAEKNYPRVVGENALDLTVMFVPIEGAMSAALALNQDLQSEAFKRRVVFASPNTLMALLTVVERLWTRDKLQRQVGAIGEDAGKVLDAVTAFLDDFDKLGMHLQRAGDAFGLAQRRLRDSDQSVVSRTRRLVEQGAKGKKLLREELQPVAPSNALPLILEDEPEQDEPKLL